MPAKNFFESRRDELNLNRTEMGARIGTTAETVRTWEVEKSYPARIAIAKLAKDYDVTQEIMAAEVMSLRQRIEQREAKQLATAAK